MELLQDEDFEHEYWIKGWATALPAIAIRIAEYVFNIASESFPINNVGKFADAGHALSGFGFLLMVDECEKITASVLTSVFHEDTLALIH